jgi:hypothetical protein
MSLGSPAMTTHTSPMRKIAPNEKKEIPYRQEETHWLEVNIGAFVLGDLDKRNLKCLKRITLSLFYNITLGTRACLSAFWVIAVYCPRVLE